jgi:hypothetical protein
MNSNLFSVKPGFSIIGNNKNNIIIEVPTEE